MRNLTRRKKICLVTLIFLIILLPIMLSISSNMNNRYISFTSLNLSSQHSIDIDWSRNWSYYESGDGSSTSIGWGHYGGEYNVLTLTDEGYEYISANYTFESVKSNGKVDFYVRSNKQSSKLEISLQSGNNLNEKVIFDVGQIRVYNGSAWDTPDTFITVSAETWYKVGLEFDCINRIWRVYVNDILKNTDPLISSVNYFEGISLKTCKSNGGLGTIICYTAWIDFSWDITPSSPPIPGFSSLFVIIGVLIVFMLIFLKKRDFKMLFQ